MIPGISTACFYPLYTEEALQLLTKQPPACIEVFLNAASELETPFLRMIKKMADDAGIRIVSVHPYTSGVEPMYFFSGYDRRFQEGMEIYKRFYQAANLLGAEILVFHGAMRRFAMSNEEYFDRFAKLWEEGKAHGIDLCQENVVRCASYTPHFFTQMAKALPDAGFVLDIKQVVRADEDVYRFADMMGKNIRHVHLSDHNSDQNCILPGAGILNIAKLLSIISKNGFDGAVIVELYADSFDSIVEINESYSHLSTIISAF